MKQRGFTMVEIAIVLVIVGLLLGGILKGQSLISGSQAKDVIATIDELRTATVYFKNRFNYLPGDLPAPANYITAAPLLVAGTGGSVGNGSIEGAIAAGGAAAVGSEVAQAPWQLYNAGLIGRADPNAPTQYLRTNFGAVHMAAVATANGLVGGYVTANPDVRNTIVLFNLPCDVVIEVDGKTDDGNAVGGRGIGSSACPGATVATYVVPLF